jgi:glutaredoxin
VKELLHSEIENGGAIIINSDSYLQENRDSFLQFIFQMTNIHYRTFPMVFFEGTFIGGYTETKKWLEQKDAFSEFDN